MIHCEAPATGGERARSGHDSAPQRLGPLKAKLILTANLRDGCRLRTAGSRLPRCAESNAPDGDRVGVLPTNTRGIAEEACIVFVGGSMPTLAQRDSGNRKLGRLVPVCRLRRDVRAIGTQRSAFFRAGREMIMRQYLG